MVDYKALIHHLEAVEHTPFGLVTHQAVPATNILISKFKDRLASLFAPEHGFFGLAAAGEKTDSTRHPYWNRPVHSLYGKTRHPSPEMLNGLGRIVIDLQDIGTRCFTYLATIKLVLEAAAEAKIPVTVVDRPIPLGGILDGPMRTPELSSFVAPLNVPLCHGMTPGEAATWIVREEALDLDLTVIRMRKWSHTARAPWENFIPPSPAIRSWDSAAIYPATVFTEAFPAIDCDRSGSLAFRVIGAPWFDTAALIKDLTPKLKKCGLGIRYHRYVPTSGSYANTPLDGMLLSVERPKAFYPVKAGIIILATIAQKYPDKYNCAGRPEWFAKLFGSSDTLEKVLSGELSTVFQGWVDDQSSYAETRVNLYPYSHR